MNNGFFTDYPWSPKGNADIAVTGAGGSRSAERFQTVFVSDLISEGPIAGLVDGESSVFLNDIRVKSRNQSSANLSLTTGSTIGGASLTFTSATTATFDNSRYTIGNAEEGTKYLIIRSITSVPNVSISSFEVSGQPFAVAAISLEPYISNNPYTIDSIPLRIYYNGAAVEFFATSSNGSSVYIQTPGTVIPTGNYEVEVDQIIEISTISGNVITFAQNAPVDTGTYFFDITSGITQVSPDSSTNNSTNFQDVSVQFRTGNEIQAPLQEKGGVGSASFGIAVNQNLDQVPKNGSVTHNFGYDDEDLDPQGIPVTIQGSTIISGGSGGSYSAAELDEVSVFINYNSLITYKEADTIANYAFYQVDLTLKREGLEWEQSPLIILENKLIHSATSSSAVSFEINVDLEQYKPFTDFRIRITRLTASVSGSSGVQSSGEPWNNDRYRGSSQAQISQAFGIIKDKFTYPFTAYSGVTFSSEEFQSIPTRTYECKGMKLRVPTNYVTRDEAPDGIANYNRDVSNGAVLGVYQDWDGEFRTGVYCNNPAWVFYDILTNNRYGLGAWIEDLDIDKFALFRIAKYCDELVPDGKGGLEPRFTCNLYLTKAVEAYKVLKDMATVFRSIIYWMDNSIIPVMDQPREPVASFTTANIENGIFNYTGTGSKTRTNQVIVTWNNPDASYALQPILVEDTESIVKTGKVITENAVAMGCTSEGQAFRYGRWKLWTAKNQNEIVTFKTAMAGTVLFPGDIITISDTNRYVKSSESRGDFQPTRYGGRLIAASDGTTMKLDRTVELAIDYTYTLSLYISEPGAFLLQDTATINSITYEKGDYVPTFANGAPIVTSQDASNVKDDVGKEVQLDWNKYSRVETQPIIHNTNTIEIVDELTAANTFTVSSATSTIWVLNGVSTAENAEILTSGKLYKLIGIEQENPGLYKLSAMEHYNEKFDAIEKNFTLSVADRVDPPEDTGSVVPPPRSLVLLNTQDPKKSGNEFKIQWRPPRNVNNTEVYTDGVYEYLEEYEISHNIPEYQNPIRVSADVTGYSFTGVSDGTYRIGVRTVSSNKNKSSYTIVSGDIIDPFDQSVPRLLGLAKGATVSTPLGLSLNTQTVGFEKSLYAIRPVQLSSGRRTSTVGKVEHESENVSAFVNPLSSDKDVSGNARVLVQNENSVFLYYRPQQFTADPYTLISPDYSTFSSAPFWYNKGNGTALPSSNTTALTGTVTIQADSNVMTGSATAFTSELSVGQMIYFGALVDDEPAKVSYIQSDTIVYLDRTFDAKTGVSVNKIGISPDFVNDCLLGRVYFEDNQRQFDSYCIVDPGFAAGLRAVSLTSSTQFLNFSAAPDYTPQDHPASITLTASAQGYTNPVFKIAGSGFSSIIGEASDTNWVDTGTGTYTRVLNGPFNYTTNGEYSFTVTVTEDDDRENTAFQATGSTSIGKLVGGADGTDGDNGIGGENGFGENGADGSQSYTGYLFYYQLLAGDAAAPSGVQNQSQNITSFNFNTGILTLASSDATFWKQDQISVTPGDLNTQWYVRYFVYQAPDGQQTISFDSPVKGISFAGAVTFQDLSDPNKSTIIDGALIKTGKIAADRLILDGVTIGKNNNGAIYIPNFAVDTLQIGGEAVTAARSSNLNSAPGTPIPVTTTASGNDTTKSNNLAIQIDWGTNDPDFWPNAVLINGVLTFQAQSSTKEAFALVLGSSRNNNTFVSGTTFMSGNFGQRSFSMATTFKFEKPQARVEKYYLRPSARTVGGYRATGWLVGGAKISVLGVKR